MAKEEKKQDKKPSKTPEEIEAEKAAKVAKKAEMAAKAKEAALPAAAAARRSRQGEEKAKGGEGQGRRRQRSQDATKAAKRSRSRGYVPRLTNAFEEQIAPALMQKFGSRTSWPCPGSEKIVISMGLGKAIAEGAKARKPGREGTTLIAGQKAVRCKAKKSVANFKVREGMETASR